MRCRSDDLSRRRFARGFEMQPLTRTLGRGCGRAIRTHDGSMALIVCFSTLASSTCPFTLLTQLQPEL